MEEPHTGLLDMHHRWAQSRHYSKSLTTVAKRKELKDNVWFSVIKMKGRILCFKSTKANILKCYSKNGLCVISRARHEKVDGSCCLCVLGHDTSISLSLMCVDMI